MPPLTQVLITAIYHPKPGLEKQFIKCWNEKVARLALTMGAELTGLFYNESSDGYIATALWPERALCDIFMDCTELEKATLEVNKFCLVPVKRTMFDILKRVAA